ncbi:hypothetical protein CFP65_0947 [Kitasatospora sp. MMS16-BH015]|uniref:hypothetical protein n=1 Tax=Kitasatospora sp. MMS16-BH015 TaxID=2018025 RepID=UPI000CA31849|nr:hypothetical protein [Kitasatospora sp. MMS16-BH015]AUG75866.1 hypothetical protein CFP65_0947 [Kitasatospora sp. MMS16-BH015]
MNRSRQIEMFEGHGLVADGVTVLRDFGHPTRGIVRCPAAPLVRAWLHRRGVSARLGEYARPGTPVGHDPLTVSLVSYLEPAGQAIGIAVATPPGLAWLGRETVEDWSRVLRTRRVLVPGGAGTGDGGGCRGLGDCRHGEVAARLVTAYRERGDLVLLVGSPDGAAEGEWAEDLLRAGEVVAVRETGEVAGLAAGVGEERVSYVVHPGAVVEEVAVLLAALRERFPRLRGQHPDQWCYAASDRRHALEAVSELSDLVLALGEQDAARLTRVAGRAARPVAGLADLLPELLAPAATVGLLPPRPGGGPTVGEMVEVLSGLGPISLLEQRSLSEVRTDVSAGRGPGVRR